VVVGGGSCGVWVQAGAMDTSVQEQEGWQRGPGGMALVMLVGREVMVVGGRQGQRTLVCRRGGRGGPLGCGACAR